MVIKKIKFLLQNSNKTLLFFSSFIAGFSLMTVELTSTRILAPYVGSSIYTWTSAIGIILLGLSAGNYFGGYLIDKNKSIKTIFLFFILSALSVALIPIAAVFSPLIVLLNIPLPLLITLLSIVLFLVPSIFFGTLYPSLLRLYSANNETLGTQSGLLSALWSLGSIVGTFMTGFYFIGYFGSNLTISLIAILLFLNGLFFYRPKKLIIIVLIIVLATIGSILITLGSPNKDIFVGESNYYKIQVVDDVADGLSNTFKRRLRFLLLDFDSHSIESLDGERLNTYPEIYPVFSVFNKNIKDILVIGGGSYSISKFFSGFYKNANITTIEIDPMVKKIAEKFFNLNSYPIKSEISDGRIFLQKNKNQYDLIFSDAYNSFISIPWHMTTYEFHSLAKTRLNKNGIYAINFISALDGENSYFFQSIYTTFKKVFPNNYVFAFGTKPSDPQNIILVGINSNDHMATEELSNKISNLENGQFLSSQLVLNPPSYEENVIILTDNFAPAERLMNPLIKNYFAKFAQFYYSLLFYEI